MDLAELLRSGDLDAFAEARERVSRIELVAEEFAEANLRGADLSGVILDKSDFTGADLTEATLVHASLADIDGEGMILDGILGMAARFRGAWLEAADLTGADVSRGDLTDAVLHRTKGEGLRAIASKLKDVGANEASWPLADLSEAVLKGADFTGADLTRAKMTETQGGGATFADADLSGIDAVGFKAGGANFKGTKLVGARLQSASFVGADLTGADLSQADLSKANLAGADLTGANLTGARLIDASLEGATLDDVVWDGADLTGLDVVGLGLDEAAIDKLVAHGAPFDPDAPWIFDDSEVAVSGEATATVWLNPDAPDVITLRWALSGPSGMAHGVLPVQGASVLFHTVVGLTDGFRVVIVVERGGGVVAVSWPLSTDGVLGRSERTALPYEPAVLPVVRAEGDEVLMWALARRGPTIVVQRDRLDGQGFQVVSSETKAQARGFMGRCHPILLCKGGVVMTLGPEGLGPPRRTPDGFPSRTSIAAPTSDGLVAVWGMPERGLDPGGLRAMDLSERVARDPEVLSERPDVIALDAMPVGSHAVVAWIDADEDDLAQVWVARLPGGRPVSVDIGDGLAVGVRIVEGVGGPWLAVATAGGDLVVGDLQGKVRTRLTEPGA